MTKPINKFLAKKLTVSTFEVDEALKSNHMIISELAAYLLDDPNFLSWLDLPVQNENVIQSMTDCAIPNKRGEYDNLDITVRSAWSKQKGIGKSSAAVTVKAIGDEVIMGRAFCHDEIFFYPKAKIQYVRENAGTLTNRYLLLDEMLPQYGISSKADVDRLKWIDTTSRIHGFNNYYVSPQGEELGLSTDYQLWVFLKDTKNETNICAVVSRQGKILGPLILKIPSQRIWKKYQQMKHKFRFAVDSGKVVAMDVTDIVKELDEKYSIREKYAQEIGYYNNMAAYKLKPKEHERPKPVTKLEPRLEAMMLSINQMLTHKELQTFKQLIMIQLEDEFK